MGKSKKLSNPFSTGGGGGHFEASVQACFVTLMLTGGYAPALPRWPIVEVKLQGKVDGFETDDLVVHVENPSSRERRKLLGQLKHAVAFTAGSEVLGQVHKAREILHSADSPLSLRDGTWIVSERAELWSILGSRLLDRNLDTFKTIAKKVLAERDPAFELPAGERYAAGIYGKVTTYSPALRKGLAEGLALLGTAPDAATHCSRGKPEATCASVVRDVLTDADWVVWGSLNNLLPTLAEASPLVFLDAVERATTTTPCPFDELFSQEGNGLTGGNYLTGLLWALEGLAWDPELLVRVSVVLGDVASHDPGGTWTNRPSNSLVTNLINVQRIPFVAHSRQALDRGAWSAEFQQLGDGVRQVIAGLIGICLHRSPIGAHFVPKPMLCPFLRTKERGKVDALPGA